MRRRSEHPFVAMIGAAILIAMILVLLGLVTNAAASFVTELSLAP